MSKVSIVFEHNYDEHPPVREGPFVWVEMIGGNMFGCRDEDLEAEEIAGVNDDGTWDAGPYKDRGDGKRRRRRYTRWTIHTVEDAPETNPTPAE